MNTNDMTITDVEFYEEFHEKLEEFGDMLLLHQMVDEAWADIKAGVETYPAEEVMAELRAKMDSRRGLNR
jgi:hypothetical protein